MFNKPNAGIMIGYTYSCGCKTRSYYKQIFIGKTGKAELYTNKLLKAVKEGYFGEEWKELYSSNPAGSVECGYDLYICENCGHWENEEILDFYMPEGNPAHKAVNFFIKDDPYKLVKKYIHFCKKCGKEMECRHLVDYEEVTADGKAIYEARHICMKTIYDAHLVCPKCKENIVLMVPEIGMKYSEYKPE